MQPKKALRMLDELERVQLIQRIRQGQGKPTKFYIKNIKCSDNVLTYFKKQDILYPKE